MRELKYEKTICPYFDGCNDYEPTRCECEPELCWKYQMFLEEEIKQSYKSHIKVAT